MENRRVVMIGDAAVGKTSLVCSLFDKPFDHNYEGTIGAAFHTYSRPSQPSVSMQIWDTAGQERYKALGPVYYRNTSAAILVYDLSAEETLSNLSMWLTTFRDVVGPSVPVFVVGNKLDLFQTDPETVQQGETWANDQGMKYFKTSAKTGVNVKLMFETVLETVAEKQSSTETVIKEPEEAPPSSRRCC